jgi:hypothetical protein
MSKRTPRVEHLVRRGAAGEIGDIRQDLTQEFYALLYTAIAEYVAPAAASAVSLKAATATATTALVWTAADLIGAGVLAHPRQVSLTVAGVTPADAPATAVVEGIDVRGRAMSETLTVPQTATSVTSTKCFKVVTKVTFAVGDGTGATVSMGHGAGLGLPMPPKPRNTASFIPLMREYQDAAEISPATGTLSLASVNGPYGMYTPVAAPNGTRAYTITYEGDPTVAI